jgi:hypothetical protein
MFWLYRGQFWLNWEHFDRFILADPGSFWLIPVHFLADPGTFFG